MTTDKTPATLAEPRSHRWNDVGERCLDCGDEDWMGSPCSGPRKPSATLAVEVLEVMDELIDFEERHAEYEPRQNHEAREARVAFAGLIEADTRIAEKAIRKAGGGWWMISNDDMNSLRAALARVKGESA